MQYSRLSSDSEAEQLASYPEEKRLTLRLWRYWNSLRGDRLFPALSDFEVDTIGDLAKHAFMLDFREIKLDPALYFIGRELRRRGDSDPSSLHVSKLEKGSMLGQAVRHYAEVFRRRGPVGLEDSYTDLQGDRFEFRGIMLPFSEDGHGIDFVVGAITYRKLLPAADAAAAQPTVGPGATLPPAPANAGETAAGPAAATDTPMVIGGGVAQAVGDRGAEDKQTRDELAREETAREETAKQTLLEDQSADSSSRRAATLDTGVSASARKLAESLRECKALAQQFAAAESRTRESLYRMLGRAYRFHFEAEAAPAAFVELCSDVGIKPQARAPFTPMVKLIFGPDYDKTRLSEYAAVLRHAKRTGQTATSFARFLESRDGGIKGCVQAERTALQVAAPSSGARLETARVALRQAASVARLPDAGADGAEFVVLIGRRSPGAGGLEILDIYDEAPSVVDRMVRRAAKLLAKPPAKPHR